MAVNNEETLNNKIQYITEEDINLIVSKYTGTDYTKIDNFSVRNASTKMLGFLAEYLKIKVQLKDQVACYFFVKAISRTNAAKADMVREMKLFDKEMHFYLEIKKIMDLAGVKPYSARLITVLQDALVFEDLNAMQYKIRSKFKRFDLAHTVQALKTLARLHASSIIFEENKKKERNNYKIIDDYGHILHKGGYYFECEWYIQCMRGALEAIKLFSKYDQNKCDVIDRNWSNVWRSALDINEDTSEQRKVICHRDLWNNNIMFHYKKVDENDFIPDNCLLVDFQAVRYQPPASDIMLLLCCNLDPKFRKENLVIFLNIYYAEMQKILGKFNIQIENVMTKDEFLKSAEEQTKWGLVICACLMPQFWIDDDETMTIFSDNEQFNNILCKNKGLFIKKMMQSNSDYKQKVMEIFQEIADRYCL